VNALAVHGRRVWCSDGGVAWADGRPWVVFLHGAGGAHSVWQQQTRALAHHGFNVAAPDLPGHGGSEDAPLATVGDHAQWVEAFCKAAGIARAALVGHSLGAAAALECAARSPARVAALVLVGAGPTMPVSPLLLEDTSGHPARAVDFITAYAHGRPSHLGGAPTPGNWLMGGARALLRACTPAVLHRDFAACNDWHGEEAAARVRCPALVVTGAGDRMTPPQAGRALAGLIPGARYETMAGAGHFVQTETPRVFLKLLRAFLAGGE
jgi:pimeloyl-ACP methyl ester carboxylesterase